MDNENHTELAKYLPLVEGEAVEDFRRKNGMTMPIALEIDEYQVAAGITTEFKSQFEEAVTKRDVAALEQLKNSDNNQYFCGLLFLIDSLASQKNKRVNQEKVDQNATRIALVNEARSIIRFIPEAREFLLAMMAKNVKGIAPKLSAFIAKYTSDDAQAFSDNGIQASMRNEFKQLPDDEFLFLTKELQDNMDEINKTIYWKARLAFLLETDGRLAQGLEGVQKSSFIDYRKNAARLTEPEKTLFIRNNAAMKLSAISYVNASNAIMG